jgi:hypothetical protein
MQAAAASFAATDAAAVTNVHPTATGTTTTKTATATAQTHVQTQVLQHSRAAAAAVSNEVNLMMSFSHPHVVSAHHFVTWQRKKRAQDQEVRPCGCVCRVCLCMCLVACMSSLCWCWCWQHQHHADVLSSTQPNAVPAHDVLSSTEPHAVPWSQQHRPRTPQPTRHAAQCDGLSPRACSGARGSVHGGASCVCAGCSLVASVSCCGWHWASMAWRLPLPPMHVHTLAECAARVVVLLLKHVATPAAVMPSARTGG